MMYYWIPSVFVFTALVCASLGTQSWSVLHADISSGNSMFDDAPWIKSGTQLKVGVSVSLSSLRSSGLSELEITFHLAQIWMDSRLSFNASSISSKYSLLGQDIRGNVWSPDTYPENTISALQHDVTTPNIFFRIYPNGTAFKSNRLTVKLLCPVYSGAFPHGEQDCSVQFKSYAFTRDDISLFWIGNGVRVIDKFVASGIYLSRIDTEICDEDVYSEEQPCIEMILHLTRNVEKYILRIYLPSTVFVVLAYLSLWIDKTQVAARTSLGIICLLSVVTQSLGMMLMTDDIDGLLAVDIWMGMCLLFTSSAFCVFTVIHNIKRQTDKRSQDFSDNTDKEKGRRTTNCNVRYQKLQNIVRTIYPIAFVVFNLIYWSVLMTR